MTIEINHMDTLLMVKGILDTIYNTGTPECINEVAQLLNQMDKVPSTDDRGYFIKEDPRANALKKLKEFSCYDKIEEYLDKEPDVKHAYINLESNIGEAMGPVAYMAWLLKMAINAAAYKHVYGTEWIDNFLKWYENTSFVKG